MSRLFLHRRFFFFLLPFSLPTAAPEGRRPEAERRAAGSDSKRRKKKPRVRKPWELGSEGEETSDGSSSEKVPNTSVSMVTRWQCFTRSAPVVQPMLCVCGLFQEDEQEDSDKESDGKTKCFSFIFGLNPVRSLISSSPLDEAFSDDESLSSSSSGSSSASSSSTSSTSDEEEVEEGERLDSDDGLESLDGAHQRFDIGTSCIFKRTCSVITHSLILSCLTLSGT